MWQRGDTCATKRRQDSPKGLQVEVFLHSLHSADTFLCQLGCHSDGVAFLQIVNGLCQVGIRKDELVITIVYYVYCIQRIYS